MPKAIQRVRITKHDASSVTAGRLRQVGDGLMNVVSGMGTAADKLTSTIFATRFANKQQLDAAYSGDWISRKIVDIPAEDSTREWRSWQTDPNAITAIEDVEKQFRIQSKTKLAMQKARLYGGAVLVMGVEVGNPEDELLPDQVTRGSLKFVHAMHRHELGTGQIIRDITSPYFGEPEYYTVSGVSGPQVRIHPSRVVRFQGMEPADWQVNNGWGDSVLQVVQDAVISTGTVIAATAQLVQESKVDVVKVPELAEQMLNAKYEGRLKQRFAIANQMKSLYSLLLIDSEEEWQRITGNFTALPDLLRLYLMVASGAADIPATRMYGQAPQGMNATGDSDTRNYYDRCSTDQKNDIQPTLKRLDDVMIMSTLGRIPDGIFYNWNPLWQLSDAEKADIAVKKATVMTADSTAALIDAPVLKAARENQLIEDGTYPGLEGFIEQYGTDPATAEYKTPPAANNNEPGSVPEEGSQEQLERTAADRMAQRIRDAKIDDATPRALYIRRDVLNAKAIIAHYKAQGLDPMITPDDMHVTILYTLNPVDWMKAGEEPWQEDDKGGITIKAGGPRMQDIFGPGAESRALVLMFASSALGYRHYRLVEDLGAEVSYPDYQPHVTLTYNAPPDFDPDSLEPWRGPIVLGPEIFEDTQSDWKSNVTEDANA